MVFIPLKKLHFQVFDVYILFHIVLSKILTIYCLSIEIWLIILTQTLYSATLLRSHTNSKKCIISEYFLIKCFLQVMMLLLDHFQNVFHFVLFCFFSCFISISWPSSSTLNRSVNSEDVFLAPEGTKVCHPKISLLGYWLY